MLCLNENASNKAQLSSYKGGDKTWAMYLWCMSVLTGGSV